MAQKPILILRPFLFPEFDKAHILGMILFEVYLFNKRS